MERWAAIPSEPGYEVSTLGRVRSVDRVVVTSSGPRRYRGRILKPGLGGDQYLTVSCGKGNTRRVHELVLEAFVGPRPLKAVCLHADDNKANPVLENLAWGTYSQNLSEAYERGRRC